MSHIFFTPRHFFILICYASHFCLGNNTILIQANSFIRLGNILLKYCYIKCFQIKAIIIYCDIGNNTILIRQFYSSEQVTFHSNIATLMFLDVGNKTFLIQAIILLIQPNSPIRLGNFSHFYKCFFMLNVCSLEETGHPLLDLSSYMKS